MLESVNLSKAVIKGEYKGEIKRLKGELAELQQTVKERKLPIMILIDGWGASGKGSMISQMISALDPRSFKVYAASEVDSSEKRRPLMWRYWNKLPEYGRIHILDRSWYQEVSVRALEDGLSEGEVSARLEGINTFERQLTDDGYLIVKFFLHISRKEQKRRLEKLADNKHTAWRVKPDDWRRNRKYDEYYQAFDRMCKETDTTNAPWHVLGCHNKEEAVFNMLSTLVGAINSALDKKIPAAAAVDEKPFPLVTMPRLKGMDLDKSLEESVYKEELKVQQKILFNLQNKLYAKKIPVVIAFEGWDAAGKGGAIKRVAEALDPRGYEAIPVAAPNSTELNHHYLWRFWSQLPKSGHLAIFDRSWYGRVMVERVEGFTKEARWKAAYREINEFEWELVRSGVAVVKFWLQVSKDEQLERFTLRQNTPEKRWKITDEDWRNREKWDVYEPAIQEMLDKTSTSYAPWCVVEANDKLFARLKVIKTLNSVLKEILD